MRQPQQTETARGEVRHLGARKPMTGHWRQTANRLFAMESIDWPGDFQEVEARDALYPLWERTCGCAVSSGPHPPSTAPSWNAS